IGADPAIPNAFDSSVIGATSPANLNNFGVGSMIKATTITGPSLSITADGNDSDEVRLAIVAFAADL
ncbi:MAG: hypothetical protein ABIR32_20310, partial [Ilumatobacteraceae bacterium]